MIDLPVFAVRTGRNSQKIVITVVFQAAIPTFELEVEVGVDVK